MTVDQMIDECHRLLSKASIQGGSEVPGDMRCLLDRIEHCLIPKLTELQDIRTEYNKLLLKHAKKSRSKR